MFKWKIFKVILLVSLAINILSVFIGIICVMLNYLNLVPISKVIPVIFFSVSGVNLILIIILIAYLSLRKE